MRFALPIAFLFVAACGGGGSTTPKGPIGKPMDLRTRLPKDAAARAPVDDKATAHEYAVDVHGVGAKVVWRTFEDGGARYILSVGWAVETPKSGVSVEPLGVMNPENAGTESEPVQAEIVRARWREGSSSGDIAVKIDATGDATGM